MITGREIASQVFAILAMICTFLLWIPQIYHNYHNKSTDSFPAALVVLWLSSAVLSTAYYTYIVQSPIIIFCWVCFCFFSVVILFQIAFYKQQYPILVGIGSFLGTGGCIVGVYFTYVYWKAFQPYIGLFNAIVPPIILVLGFAPQFYWIFQSKSTKGIAVGMIIVDLLLCVFAIIALLLHDLNAYVSVIPFVIIIVMELGILLLKLVVFPDVIDVTDKNDVEEIEKKEETIK